MRTMVEKEGALYLPLLCGKDNKDNIFWSDNLTLNTNHPRLSRCFQNTLLVGLPFLCLLMMSCCHVPQLLRRSMSRHHWNRYILLKLLLLILLCITCSIGEVFRIISGHVDSILAGGLKLIGVVLATVVTVLEHWTAVASSPLFLYWLVDVLCGTIIFIFATPSMLWTETNITLTGVFFTMEYILKVLQMVMSSIPYQLAYRTQTEEEKPLLLTDMEAKENPDLKPTMEATCSFPSKLTFWWIFKLLWKGFRKPLDFEELPGLLAANRAKNLDRTFTDIWKRKCRKQKRPALLYALYQALWKPFLLAGLHRFIATIAEFLNPIILWWLIGFISGGDPYDWKGYVAAVAMFLAAILATIPLNHFLMLSNIVGLRARSMLTAQIHRKVLRLSTGGPQGSSVGRVVNLVAVDASVIQQAPMYVHLIWYIVVTTVACAVLLWYVIGVASVAGLALLLLLLPLNGGVISNKMTKLQEKQMEAKDNRVKLTSEILGGIKVLKLNAWEEPFQNRILNERKAELAHLRKAQILYAISSVGWFMSPYLVSLAIFATYVLLSPSNVLTAEKAFVTMSVVNVLNFPLSMMPAGVSFVAQAYIAIKRMEEFLSEDELHADEQPQLSERGSTSEFAVQVQNGYFSWEKDKNSFSLEKINMDVRAGSLTAIVGPVGSGKSSLVSAMLGEMHTTKGTVINSTNVAYVPQQAWILHASLRDNILFGRPWNEHRYMQVLEACALLPDLQTLPAGDKTEIGEKGINLSGGQKQRVSLARAAYRDSDTYLMDDPLSAVDAHVAEHLFTHVIGPHGLLKHKTRILVTHNVKFLPVMDQVYYMNNGRINAVDGLHGTNVNVQSSNVFAELSAEKTDELNGFHQMTVEDQSKGEAQEISSTDVEKLVEEEATATGRVKWWVIGSYIRSGGLVLTGIIITCQLLFVTSQIVTSIWLSDWTDSSDTRVNKTQFKLAGISVTTMLGVYGGLGATQLMFCLAANILLMIGCVIASSALHSELLARLMNAPMSFFDTTPAGRIINRLSKDMYNVDTNMPNFIVQWMYTASPILATVVVISYTTPAFLLVVMPLAVVYILIQMVYIAAVRQLKRIESVSLSPLFSHFEETLAGVTSIRAYREEDNFFKKTLLLLDNSQIPWYYIAVAQRWLAVQLDVMGGLVIFLAVFFAVGFRHSITGSLAGLSITYALQMTAFLCNMVRASTEIEINTVSVERVLQYTDIDQEARSSTFAYSNWPTAGKVEFRDFQTRYRSGLEPVLRGVSCLIHPREKVGVVGRTGAGKSSLALALFRIIERTAGAIYIDGVDIASLSLYDLRSKLTIIPQDPVILTGSLRQNVDPGDEYDDRQIWEALEDAHLKPLLDAAGSGLEYQCQANGANFSVGQRQLVCLARALLRKSQVLILDEATAAVDAQTDNAIQGTIRTKFNHCTVVTIAHRIHTVMDYDRIMVLENGYIKEFDNPDSLLQNPRSEFSKLVKHYDDRNFEK